jgi:hypothetical protein
MVFIFKHFGSSMDDSVLQLKHGNSVARDGREGKTKHRKEKNNGKNIKKEKTKKKQDERGRSPSFFALLLTLFCEEFCQPLLRGRFC